MKISKHNAEHYLWGDNCDGWHLVKNQELSIIHEHMPGNTSEVRHYHLHSRQFFFILSGSATLEVNGQRNILKPQEGYEVPPQVPHQIFNHTGSGVELLVISQPNSKGDRVLVNNKFT
ncbi:cupin domain-containing protein [Peribacillus saganii]|uniref:Cupin domain-containing protein n=1 Tax=Peribacillus saganii TaxID=2303992 RepID=A0A372LTC6_9BACI|nr:cupin domain-containing protein [Peribacillus saganii]RFU71050.1 cupin domain-containing protein [Peribacillus saganii]